MRQDIERARGASTVNDDLIERLGAEFDRLRAAEDQPAGRVTPKRDVSSTARPGTAPAGVPLSEDPVDESVQAIRSLCDQLDHLKADVDAIRRTLAELPLAPGPGERLTAPSELALLRDEMAALRVNVAEVEVDEYAPSGDGRADRD